MLTDIRWATVLPTEEELARRQRRQSWWLLAARLASGRTQSDAAAALGLTAGSSYGDFERGETPPSLKQLVALAALFDVPLSLFTDPPATDEEKVEQLGGFRSRRTLLLANVPVRRAS